MKLTVLVVIFVTLLAMPAFAGYQVTSIVDELADSYSYTWSVTNYEPGTNGFEGFYVLVNNETNVINWTVPPPRQPAPGAYWSFGYVYSQINAQGQMLISEPPEGKKWLSFWGETWNSCYLPGSTAIFQIVTDKSTVPGQVDCTLAAYASYGNYPLAHYAITGPTTPVPEPSSLLALAGGIIPLGLVYYRRKH